MLSLITCARAKDVSEELRRNIATTIGTDYELIVIDNSSNDHSIFSAYNEGVRRSKGDILCFMHDDILYQTINWGVNVQRHFENHEVGLLGVAGGYYLPAMPCYWFQNAMDRSINIIQHENRCKEACLDFMREGEQEKNEVVAVDGVWFCIRKNLFGKISFDEHYNGFHMYDMDICMQIRQLGLKLFVVYDVLIEHMSLGNAGCSWLDAALAFWKKWKQELPQYTEDFRWTPKRKKDCWRVLYKEVISLKRFGHNRHEVRALIKEIVPKMPCTLSKYILKVLGEYFGQ